MSKISVRRAGVEDTAIVIDLLVALAEYEKLTPPDAAGRERLSAELVSATPRFEAYIAELGGNAIGCAVVFETYGTFRAKPKLYIEDLFVLPEFRGSGAGKALFQAMIELARNRGCGAMEWTALDWNTPAHDFYYRMGGRKLDSIKVFQLEL
ncbi:GNAT family N-acetyltransferase [Dehalogenimonas etheniformans]|nr:GNAT family N-acetyltransferase [Dehalogenimonas etheniformans]QNT76639.1 GNAT family N-acetyltransferase [Dehalogenimonas etheniformans]